MSYMWRMRLSVLGMTIIILALALPALSQGFSGKMDAGLAALVRSAGTPALSSLSRHLGLNFSTPQPDVPTLILMHAGEAEQLRQDGYILNAQIGDIVSLSVPLDQIEGLANHPDIRAIELAKRYRPLLGLSTPEVRADQVRARQPDGSFVGTTGAGVVIGVVD